MVVFMPHRINNSFFSNQNTVWKNRKTLFQLTANQVGLTFHAVSVGGATQLLISWTVTLESHIAPILLKMIILKTTQNSLIAQKFLRLKEK